MAKKFKDFVVRDKPKKRGSRQHKKSLNKAEKRQKRTKRYKGQGKGYQKLFKNILDIVLYYPILNLINN